MLRIEMGTKIVKDGTAAARRKVSAVNNKQNTNLVNIQVYGYYHDADKLTNGDSISAYSRDERL
jgi:hypothetical protein